jgi:uncharacterized protein YodC (DUF2158 family)
MTNFNVGDRVTTEAGDLVGTITLAPAPGMRRVRWDDGESGDADTRDLRPLT